MTNERYNKDAMQNRCGIERCRKCESNFLPLKSPAESGAFLFFCDGDDGVCAKRTLVHKKFLLIQENRVEMANIYSIESIYKGAFL